MSKCNFSLLIFIYIINIYKIQTSNIELSPKNVFLSQYFQNKLPLDQTSAFVSCFFPLRNGTIRHTIPDYMTKASRLLNSFSSTIPLFIFTTNEGKSILESAKKMNSSLPITPNIKFILKYQSVYDIPQISKYRHQYEIISDIMIHSKFYKKRKINISAEIGSIWNSKIIFMKEIIERQDIKTKFVFWIDIGIIKTDEYFHKNDFFIWPSIERIEKIYQNKKYKDRMLFWAYPIKVKLPKSLDDVVLTNYNFFIHAAFFGGPIKCLKKFISEYWNIHDFLIKKNQFVLREEMVMSAYAVLNTDKVFLISMKDSKCFLYHSCAGFISKYNICRFKNSVFLLVPKRRYLYPFYESLGAWL